MPERRPDGQAAGMDDTTGTTPPPGPGPAAAPPPPWATPPRRPLRRSRTDRKVFGVAGGLSAYFGIDPLLVRILFVVLALSGAGAGILLYLACAALVPAEPAAPGAAGPAGSQPPGEPAGPAFVDRHGKVLAIIAGVVVVSALIGGGGPFGWGHDNGFWGVLWLGLLVTVVVLVIKEVENRRERGDAATTVIPSATTVFPPGPPGDPSRPAPPEAPTAFAAAAPPPGAPAYAPAPHWAEQFAPPATTTPPTPPSPPSGLGVLTVGAAMLAVGTLIGLDRADVTDVSAFVLLATALTVVGAGLVVGAVVGRARWLIPLGLVLAVITGIASLDLPGDGRIGEIAWDPAETEVSQEYRWGMGDAELDLTRLTSPIAHSVDVELGIGSLTVLVPYSATVDARAHVGAGTIQGLGETVDGVDRDAAAVLEGTDPTRTEETADEPVDGAQIDLDVRLGLGEVVIVRVPA
jgi:phage shock protein PspC (stress-responsive transcriptional regulator)